MARLPFRIFALAVLATAAAASAADPIGDAIHRKLDAYGPWYTSGEAAFIRARCGYAADADIRNLTIEGNVMTCCNGRRVEDPQVGVIARNVSHRAYTRTRAVLADPEVKAAIAIFSAEAARRAVARADMQLSAAPAEQHRTDQANPRL